MILDLLELTQAEDAQEYLKAVLPLPAWYGNNLDALYDCACAWHDVSLTVLHPDTAGYAQAVLTVLRDAAVENPSFVLTENS